MTRRPWEQLLELFNDVLDAPDDERSSALDAACEANPSIAEELRELFQHHAAAETFLEQPAVVAPPMGVKDRVGAYVIDAELGTGGMGSVFLAHRDDDTFDKTVAVKVVHGVVTDALIARFRSERQILASLEHPNIARLLDGGVTADGRPYLVMEHVRDAVSVVEFAKGRTLAQRLELFVNVCDAVDFAHRNLVVHRDLKPSNILVGEDGVVKLVDFGIAKTLTDDVTQTATSARMLTPSCASPEQIRGERVTTSSDVYALGVLLYSLLTGKQPYDLTGRSHTEMVSLICEHDPPKPSRAANDKLLRGDLDLIVGKAMRKDPAERYASAARLRDDIVLFRERRPITAKRASAGYVLGMLLRRHRVAATAAFTALVALLLGTTVALWQARVARVQRDRARVAAQTSARVSRFLFELFESANPMQMPNAPDVPVRVIVERGERKLAELEGQPEVRSQMLGVLGRVNATLGNHQHARELLSESLALREQVFTSPNRSLADAYHDLGRIHFLLGEPEKAFPYATRAFDERARAFGANHPKVGASLILLCRVKRKLDKAGAIDDCRKGLSLMEARLDEAHPGLSKAQKHVATALFEEGQLDAAMALYQKASAAVSTRSREHYDMAAILDGMTDVHLARGANVEAARASDKALAIKSAWLAAEHPALADSLDRKGMAAAALGDRETAIAAWTRGIEILRSAKGRRLRGMMWRLAMTHFRAADLVPGRRAHGGVSAVGRRRQRCSEARPATLGASRDRCSRVAV